MKPNAAATVQPLPLPRFLQIEPVGQCNLRCKMCPIQFRQDGSPGGPPAFLPLADFERLLDQFADVSELHLQGLGEPLMHPDFFAMVRCAVRRGIEVSTNSNLTVLSERRAAECVASGLARIYVSIDGASAQTYERIRVRARFDRVLRNVRRLLGARRAQNSAHPDIRLVAVAMRQNLHELPDLARLAHELGIDNLSVQHLCHDFGEESLPERYRPMRAFVDSELLTHIDPAVVVAALEQAREMATALGVTLRLALARCLLELRRTSHAVLHSLDPGSRIARQHGAPRCRSRVKWRGVPRLSKPARERDSALSMPVLFALPRDVLITSGLH